MHRKLPLLIFMVVALVSPWRTAHAQDAVPVEIVVTGKQPGPPMWRVTNGNNTLYIFAWLSPIPKDMVWESDRVEQVISEAQEYIPKPEADLSVSPLMMLNPINIFRGIRLGRRLTRNEDGATLDTVLPPALYQRYSALKSSHFPRDKKIERMRPLVAGPRMVSAVQEQAGLEPATDVSKKIRRLVKKNRDITVTEIKHEMQLEGGFKDIASRVESMMDSIPLELELSCFERQLNSMEEGIGEMQYRASTWAQGYIQEFKFIPLPGDDEDDCTNLLATSTEQETYEEITTSLQKQWLDAAERALHNNTTTFAVLDFSQLLLENGLLNQLQAKGYEIIEP